MLLLGFCVYYRRFIANFKHIASPLTHLAREGVPFTWGDNQPAACGDFQQCLHTCPVLAHFDENAPTMVRTDASNVGLGTLHVQWQDSADRVIAYARKTLSSAEFNYSTTEKISRCRMSSFKVSFVLLRSFLSRSQRPYYLCRLINLKNPSGWLARWSLRFQKFDKTVVYKSGW